jgi:hypothetical protein
MRRKVTQYLFAAAWIFMLATIFLGCGGQQLASTWRDREITIDGLDDEWEGTMAYLSDANIAVGLLNDDEYLYVCLATVDSRVVRQVVGSGLTIWFDAKGGKKRSLGINFPLGMDLSREGGDRANRPMPGSGEGGPMPGFGEGGPDPEKLREMLSGSAGEMAILGPGKTDRRLMPVASSQEVRVKLGYSGGKLVYELRIPLVHDLEHPDAIGLENGRKIGVGFETAEIDREAMKERMKNGMGAGRPPMGGTNGGGPPMGGGMRGGGPRGGGMPGGQGSGGEMSERLELWIKVQLANAEDAVSL